MAHPRTYHTDRASTGNERVKRFREKQPAAKNNGAAPASVTPTPVTPSDSLRDTAVQILSITCGPVLYPEQIDKAVAILASVTSLPKRGDRISEVVTDCDDDGYEIGRTLRHYEVVSADTVDEALSVDNTVKRPTKWQKELGWKAGDIAVNFVVREKK